MAGLKEKVDAAKETQALAKPASTVMSIFTDERIKQQLALALPAGGLSAERLLRVALTTLRQNPGLADCTRESFLGALMTAAHLGLEVGGMLGHFYLVPFKNTRRGVKEVTPILGYRGMIVLARRSGEVEDVVARPYFEHDHFDFAYGLEDRLVHRPADGERGALRGFYGIARYTNGGHLITVMSKSQVDKFKERSRAKDDGPWQTDYEQMGSKTVIRRMAAYMPLSTEAAEAIAEDEQRELGVIDGAALDLGEVPPPAAEEEARGRSTGAKDKKAEATTDARTNASSSAPAASEGQAKPTTGDEPAGANPGSAGAGSVAPASGAAPAPAEVAQPCQICGAKPGDPHDGDRHNAWAAEQKKVKEEQARTSLSDDPGAAFRR